ncbi:MAG TPA: hypothetical protein VI796_02165 [Candidatus Thermoplasmatota archaeon]|nr:hypothetical protein [Candidatus Thermoplasmatota archaeon]
MRNLRAALILAALPATLLAGCSGGGGGLGISVGEPDAPGGAYTFTATGSADNYTWDLGDHLTVKYGKSIEHAYDFQNGQVTVKLTAKVGDVVEQATHALTLGTGKNSPASFLLEAQTDWTVVGESVRFSAKGSSDPDGDPLRFSWNCFRTGDAVRKAIGHTHGPVVGVPYGTTEAGKVAVRKAVAPLPAADRTVAGDLCESLGTAGKSSLDATIAGSFSRTGVYDIILLASDPVTATTSGRFTLYVTDPSERPSPFQQETFEGTFTGGAGGNLQGSGGEAGLLLDQAEHPFSLPLAGVATFVNLTWDHGALETTPGENVVSIAVQNGPNVLLAPQSEPAILETLRAGSYTLIVTLEQGANVHYTVEVTTFLNMDPTQIY